MWSASKRLTLVVRWFNGAEGVSFDVFDVGSLVVESNHRRRVYKTRCVTGRNQRCRASLPKLVAGVPRIELGLTVLETVVLP